MEEQGYNTLGDRVERTRLLDLKLESVTLRGISYLTTYLTKVMTGPFYLFSWLDSHILH